MPRHHWTNADRAAMSRRRTLVRCLDCEWQQPIDNILNIQAHQKAGHRVTYRGRVQAPITAPINPFTGQPLTEDDIVLTPKEPA